jgi:hypothetical protein
LEVGAESGVPTVIRPKTAKIKDEEQTRQSGPGTEDVVAPALDVIRILPRGPLLSAEIKLKHDQARMGGDDWLSYREDARYRL